MNTAVLGSSVRPGRRVAVLVVAGGLAVAALTGCSSNNSPKSRLEAATQQVRNAAADGTLADLRQAVAQLRTQVQDQAVNGDISAQDEQAILDAAQAVLNAARAVHHTTPTSPAATTPTFVPPTTSAPPTTPTTTTPPTTPTTTTPPATTPATSPPPTTKDTNSAGVLNGNGAAAGHAGGNSTPSSASNSKSAPAG